VKATHFCGWQKCTVSTF